RADVTIGTFGKSFGGGGAFAAASGPLIDLVWNRGRALVFSTAMAPPLVSKALWALPLVAAGPRTEALWARASAFRSALIDEGVAPLAHSIGPIVPVPVGDPKVAIAAASRLREVGVLVHAMRPPTVPYGTSRLRCVVQAEHDLDSLRAAAHSIAGALR
ncbi:MAG: aminotransferase class I/II-fold pyridoxal phosphate-dependent enzyme, partial [Polyangiales bacterium]